MTGQRVLANDPTARATVAQALHGHRLDTLSQDSGQQCECGSDSRFAQTDGDSKWTTFEEHLADVAIRSLTDAQA